MAYYRVVLCIEYAIYIILLWCLTYFFPTLVASAERRIAGTGAYRQMTMRTNPLFLYTTLKLKTTRHESRQEGESNKLLDIGRAETETCELINSFILHAS